MTPAIDDGGASPRGHLDAMALPGVGSAFVRPVAGTSICYRFV